MKKSFYFSVIALLVLASCKKENPAIYSGKAEKPEPLKITATCSTPPTFMGIRFAGGPGQDIGFGIITGAEDVTFYGVYHGTVDFEPGPGISNLTTSPHDYGLFSQRFNKAGHFIGVSERSRTEKGDPSLSDRSGHRYEIRYEQYVTDPNQIVAAYIYRYNAAGKYSGKIFLDSVNFWWINRSMVYIDNIRNVAYIACGKRIYKINHQGKIIWKRDVNTPSEYVTLKLDHQGNVYGRSWTLIKYDSNGNELWHKIIGVNARDMTFDLANNIYLTGGFGITIDFDPGPGTYYLTPENGYSGYIQKLDALGNFVWVVKPGPLVPNAIALAPYGKYVYVSGYVENTASFYPVTGKVTYTSKGEEDVFILAYKQCE